MEQEGLLVQSMYYGRIGSEATERLLERFGHDGSFLLRDSETMQGAYCLCVRKAPFVHTYRLVHSTEGWSLQISGVRQQRYRTVETLIENIRRGTASGVRIPPLTDPLDRAQLQYFSSGEAPAVSSTDFAYMEMSSSSGRSSLC
ncbi:SH2 domain-containing protein 1A-like isoform X1 [Seriola lalandi dorsalis]|uniref:SH2 domain-containing protein 1A-like isoform X1 n=1 Tax=Seriola lalandi dorsalis TaxID=1841481 RepID=UPI000C6F809A|nr:SH2 domain-containing protein 1A-like isoform X1 [Seriola lalandi dorsalis]XP_056248176.1 SH2 domain-containing protein 1A-like isoform X1 [Seriola aureovittata]